MRKSVAYSVENAMQATALPILSLTSSLLLKLNFKSNIKNQSSVIVRCVHKW